ncbi:ADP-ribose pyrophosphatase YjhB (NUDIX family) [Bacillus thuringiensis]|uniref:ADP-ribose pyrophosphatase YjhB (NUDIX family) n=1 Tax=Bacillus thuringiensis TaxID=1428 RepID=A0A4R4BHR2_BACTU|nr:NUDIX hydrolase [Bacillus thuringiensis]TCW48287.1 ADP-ribose pyrophosphatase YjhB (NUDIX family) [Bacillus thuringiensis]TCW57437.1 ADP-ribose pyrophosphatase YjhB (NUDIX family) [Bacillus thuringiensis]
MERWVGCAAVCVNERIEVLMVLQGQKGEEKRWSVPSGGLEKGETLEECCIREVWEETGYNVEVVNKIYEKEGITYGVPVYVHYYLVKKIGGSMKIQDPDELIHEIAWKGIDELKELTLSFPEDYEILNKYINKKASV